MSGGSREARLRPPVPEIMGPGTAAVLEPLLPVARTIKLRLLKRVAEFRAIVPAAVEREDTQRGLPPVFIFACGRSGTTILGELLMTHPDVCYLREPYHLWATIEPALDVTNLHVRVAPRLWWDGTDMSASVQTRFARLILAERERSGRRALIEKTPHNVYRIGLLDALTKQRARFIHIVRDGVDVVRSINAIATNQTYRMAGRGDYHQWWGSHGLKWTRLAEEGPARGHFSAHEVAQLKTPAQRAAYEWLTSLAEADRWRERLGDRLFELRYATLAEDARHTLQAITAHIGVGAPASWLERASLLVGPERRNIGDDLALPSSMADRFNEYQERYGFTNRASTTAS